MSKNKSLLDKIQLGLSNSNKAWQLFAIFTIAVLVFQAVTTTINNPSSSTLEVDDFACQTSSQEELNPIVQTDLTTVFEISSIELNSQTYINNDFRSKVAPINNPEFVDIKEIINCLGEDEEVIVVTDNNISKAYPLRLLMHHQVINDFVNGLPISVTYCLVCDSVFVYERTVKNELINLSASGILYKNNDLLYDSKTNSLWTQFEGNAVVGSLTGAKLNKVNYFRGSLKSALDKFPTLEKSASFVTKYNAPYSFDARDSFLQSEKIWGPKINSRSDFTEKELMLAFEYNKNIYTTSVNVFDYINELNTKITGNIFTITKKNGYYAISVDGVENTKIQLFLSYWYVLSDFYPDLKIIK